MYLNIYKLKSIEFLHTMYMYGLIGRVYLIDELILGGVTFGILSFKIEQFMSLNVFCKMS